MARRRRQRYDALQSIDAPTWLTVRDACARLLEYHELAPGADLRAALTAQLEARRRDGWTIGEDGPSCATVFCKRGDERVAVGIERRDPNGPPIDPGRQSTGSWG